MKLVEFSKRFPDEEACEKYLYEIRVAQGVVCSKCGSKHQYWDKSGKCWRGIYNIIPQGNHNYIYFIGMLIIDVYNIIP